MVRLAMNEQYGFSLWRFDQGALCYRAILTNRDQAWYVREWGEMPLQACGN